jgi:hypothetical protein
MGILTYSFISVTISIIASDLDDAKLVMLKKTGLDLYLEINLTILKMN